MSYPTLFDTMFQRCMWVQLSPKYTSNLHAIFFLHKNIYEWVLLFHQVKPRPKAFRYRCKAESGDPALPQYFNAAECYHQRHTTALRLIARSINSKLKTFITDK